MIRRFLAAFVVVMALSSAASACPACKEAMAAQPPDEAARLRTGYFYSILLMVGMPFTLAGVGGFCLYRAVKRGRIPEL